MLGPNGAGKSTLVKAILGLLPLAAGKATVLGRPPGDANAQIGYLPQRRNFDAGTRIRGIDLVGLGFDGSRWGIPLPGLPGAKKKARRVAEVLELVGASRYATKPIGELSGGEQQRLLIAQALVRRPQLLLLDEPLDSLDLASQAAVAALVRRSRACSASRSRCLALPTGGSSSSASPRRPSTMGTVTNIVDAAVFQGLSWNLLDDFRQLFAYPFMVNALEAGTIVAVMAGVTGWFMVLRRQTFAGHTLSVIAFPGAAAASLAGLPVAVGYFSFCGLGALALAGIAGSRRSHSSESAAIGSLQTKLQAFCRKTGS